VRNRNDLQAEISVRVAVLVRNAGGTYRAAGEQAGLSAPTISAWGRNLRTPRQASLDKLRAAS
jgi:uncharacterized protein YerC